LSIHCNLYKHNDCIKHLNAFYRELVLLLGPPTIDSVSKDKILVEEQKAVLTCNATNDIDSMQLLKFIWYSPTGAQIKPNKRFFIHKTNDINAGQIQSVLLIDPVKDTDAGAYTCRALNHPKSYVEHMIDLTVECKYFLWIDMYVLYIVQYIFYFVVK